MAGIFATGDLHGETDIRKFTNKNLYPRYEFTGTQDDNIMNVCGDFGLVWNWQGQDKSEKYWLDWLEDRPFTTAFVPGNHENFDRLFSDEFETKEWHGGQVKVIRPHVLCLMRGEVFTVFGKKIWAFGGASSHDIKDGILDPVADKDLIKRWSRPSHDNPEDWGKMFRINGRSWWPQEIASPEEMQYGMDNLTKHNNTVDWIITHCAPQTIASMMGYREPDAMTNYFNEIAHTVQFTNWYFGHYHYPARIMGKFYCLYDNIIQLA